MKLHTLSLPLLLLLLDMNTYKLPQLQMTSEKYRRGARQQVESRGGREESVRAVECFLCSWL